MTIDAALAWADQTMNERLREARRTGTNGDYDAAMESCMDTLAVAVRMMKAKLAILRGDNARHQLDDDACAYLAEVEAELAELKAQTCQICRHASHGDIDLWCTRWSSPIPSSSDVMCADILTCGAWQAREGA